MEATQSPVYAEVYRFLVSTPSLEQIIAFRASEATQERVRYLLAANKDSRLTPEEHAELDEFEQVNHFVTMLKAHARQELASKA